MADRPFLQARADRWGLKYFPKALRRCSTLVQDSDCSQPFLCVGEPPRESHLQQGLVVWANFHQGADPPIFYRVQDYQDLKACN